MDARPATAGTRPGDLTVFDFGAKRFGSPTDLALVGRRARAAALLTAALPGALYVYQGDELGPPEVEDLPRDALRDPMHFRSGGVDPGRDGCRVPLPWTETGPSYGFGAGGSWLPQPVGWGAPSRWPRRSPIRTRPLALYRAALALRRTEPALRGEVFGWLDLPEARGGITVSAGFEVVRGPGNSGF